MSVESVALRPGSMLRSDSLVRLTSTSVGVVLSFVTTIMTARWLGPAGRGNLSTIHYVCVLLSFAASLGVGEASVVLVNRRGVILDRVLSVMVLPLAAASLAGVGLLLFTASVAGWSPSWEAISAAAAFIVVGTFVNVAHGFEAARYRIAFSSRASIAASSVAVVATALLVGVMGWGLAGAMLAVLAATSTALLMLISDLRTVVVAATVRVERGLLRATLRLGAALEGAHLLMALAQRADLLVVYWLRGQAAAGIYSIALTLGQLSAYGAGALSYAAFARVSASEEPRALTLRVARMSLLMGALTAGALAVTMPVAIHTLLGSGFADSVPLAWLLSLGGVLWGLTTALARSAAASGRTPTFPAAFGTTLVVMLAGDLLLVGPFGLVGVAAASVAGCLSGLIVCLIAYRRAGAPIVLRELVPVASDLADLSAFFRSMFVRRR